MYISSINNPFNSRDKHTEAMSSTFSSHFSFFLTTMTGSICHTLSHTNTKMGLQMIDHLHPHQPEFIIL